jgi:hypothetical protein
LVDNLSRVTNGTEKLVGSFNGIFAKGMEQQVVMELESIRRGVNAVTTIQTAYLVDMAKAEALDQLGEKQEAIKLAERYLS